MTKEEALGILKYNSNVIHQTINGETDSREVEALDMAIKALEQEPKTGYWIDNMDLGYHVSICSNCDWRGHGDTCLIYRPKYCPNCGARMARK